MKTKKSIKKQLFKEKSKIDFSFVAKKETEMTTPHGIAFKQKIVIVSASFILCMLGVMLCLNFFLSPSIKAPTIPSLDGVCYFNSNEIVFEHIKRDELPSGMKMVKEAPDELIFRHYMGEQTAYYSHAMTYYDENNYIFDDVNVKMIKNNVIIQEFNDQVYLNSMERNGKYIEYNLFENVIAEDFIEYIYNFKFSGENGYTYYVGIRALASDRIYVYLDQLI